MASNGVILLNLNNRNAADFQRLDVPDSYEKASGALTAGTYVTVYKWLYQGFMMAPSLCDAVDADDHINLVDRSNGGILEVYPDDTIEIPSDHTPDPDPDPEPEPEPGVLVHDDPYYRKAVKVYRKTGVSGKLFIENGITEGNGNSKAFVGDGVEVEINASSLVGYRPGVYAVPGICIIQHGGTSPNGAWYFTSTAAMNIYSPTLVLSPWTYVDSGYSVTQGWPDDGSETSFYYVFEHRNINPGSGIGLTLMPISVSEPGVYDPSDYDVDGFSEVTVLSPTRATRVWTHSTGGNDASVYMQAGIYKDGAFIPASDAIDVLYRNASSWVEHGIVQVKYASSWSVRGVVSVQFDGNSYPALQDITTWNYSTTVDYLFIEET